MPRSAKLCKDFKTLISGKACELTLKSEFVYLQSWASLLGFLEMQELLKKKLGETV